MKKIDCKGVGDNDGFFEINAIPMSNKFDGTLSSVARSQAVERLRTNEALEEEAKETRELLRDILKDITADNMLSPDVFDRLVSEVKRYE